MSVKNEPRGQIKFKSLRGSKKVFFLLIAISLIGGFIDISLNKKKNYRLNANYYINYPPISHIINCPVYQKSFNECYKKELIKDSIKYLNNKDNANWEYNEKSIYTFIKLENKDISLISKSIQNDLKNLQKKTNKENIEMINNIEEINKERMMNISKTYRNDLENIYMAQLDLLIGLSKKYNIENKQIIEFKDFSLKLHDINSYLKIFLYFLLGILIFISFTIITENINE